MFSTKSFDYGHILFESTALTQTESNRILTTHSSHSIAFDWIQPHPTASDCIRPHSTDSYPNQYETIRLQSYSFWKRLYYLHWIKSQLIAFYHILSHWTESDRIRPHLTAFDCIRSHSTDSYPNQYETIRLLSYSFWKCRYHLHWIKSHLIEFYRIL